MSDRELLLGWLTRAAARLALRQRTRELGRAACVLIALWLFAELLRAAGTHPLVFAALVPLLAIAAVASVALFAWRIALRATPAQAAGAADARAGLKDELLSAYWFAQRAGRDAYVDLLLARAASTTARLELGRMFPVGMPRSMLAALVLAVLTGVLAWTSPRLAFPGSQASGAPGDVGTGAGAILSSAAPDRSSLPQAQAEDPRRPDTAAAWMEIDRLVKQLPANLDQDAVKRAVIARDARLAAQLMEGAERSRGTVTRPDQARKQLDMRATADAKRLLDTLNQLAGQGSKVPTEPPVKAEVSPTVRRATNVREQANEERRKIEGAPMQGSVTPNNRLRAMARNGAGMREVQYGEGEAAEGGNRASVSGAAEGERSGKSQAGGSEGESPLTSPTGEGDNDPVLGERTERLAGQLEKMSAARAQDASKQEAVEEFYAATQRQTAEVANQDVSAQWRAQREAVVAPSGPSLPYREAVKQYFLSQHARED